LPKGPEDKAKAKTLKRLRELGGWWYSVPRSRFGRAGIPDIMGCFCGQFIALELKRFDGIGNYGATQVQIRMLEEITDAGGVAWLVAREETLERLIKILTVMRKARDSEDPQGWAASLEGQGQQHV